MTDTSRPRSVVLAHGLADLAAQNPVQPGRVSPHRTYDAPDFRVRQIVLDADAVLPEHVAPSPVVITVIEGSVDFEVDAETHRLDQGAVVHLDADVPHRVIAREPSRLLLTLVGAAG